MRKQNNLIAAGLLGLVVAACSAITDAAVLITDGVESENFYTQCHDERTGNRYEPECDKELP